MPREERLSIEKISNSEYKKDLRINKLGIIAGIICSISGMYSSFQAFDESNIIKGVFYLLFGIGGAVMSAQGIQQLVETVARQTRRELRQDIKEDLIKFKGNIALDYLQLKNKISDIEEEISKNKQK